MGGGNKRRKRKRGGWVMGGILSPDSPSDYLPLSCTCFLIFTSASCSRERRQKSEIEDSRRKAEEEEGGARKDSWHGREGDRKGKEWREAGGRPRMPRRNRVGGRGAGGGGERWHDATSKTSIKKHREDRAMKEVREKNQEERGGDAERREETASVGVGAAQAPCS
ncbi:unnamed protein product [Pleuronectes platessa]|uniref:Uncharacterized protein n=1 Tax=Pleuronectes platessa TaxID=8262 RepID=A0A9N7Z7D6_PLEPL|nr:unnamed protein product [Pleuronectes platessa]